MSRWRRHWNRVLRWEARVRNYVIQPGNGEWFTLGQDEQEFADFLYAAFVVTYHLKDHLLNDQETRGAAKMAQIESFISQSDSLAHCADLANGHKHLALTRKPRRSGDGTLVPSLTLVLTPEKGEVSEFRLTMTVGGTSLDPVQMLTEAVLDWEDFLVGRAHVLKPDWRDLAFGHTDLPPRRIT